MLNQWDVITNWFEVQILVTDELYVVIYIFKKAAIVMKIYENWNIAIYVINDEALLLYKENLYV